MIKDYHIHAMIPDPKVDSEAFIRRAIDAGLREIVITDHMPLTSVCPGHRERIPAGRIGQYCEAVRSLAKKYADRIRILVGIECDYIPSLEGEIRRILAEGDFDYVLGSSHLHLWPEFVQGGRTRTDYARAILANTAAAASSGLFDAIPHLDMYRWVFHNPARFGLADDGGDPTVLPELDTALKAIRRGGLKLEINPHFAHQTGRIDDTYPAAPIFRRAREMGIPFVYGSDTHTADHVGCMLGALDRHPLFGPAIREFDERQDF